MILNLTQHKPTPVQIEEGVVDLPQPERSKLLRELLIQELPTPEELILRARRIALYADTFFEDAQIDDWRQAMIGGAPMLMPTLVWYLKERGIDALAAFSRRESVETTTPDGTVVKTAAFRHLGFVQVPLV